MNRFEKDCKELGSLETFDPAAFKEDAKVPQSLCNFLLSLAVIYNDCKDIIYSQVLLHESRPPLPVQRTRLWGTWSGLDLHTFRLLVGLLHELFNLIRDNQTVIQHPFFQAVLRQLSREERDAWEAIVSVASDATPSDPLGKRLLLIRNKVLFHYDPKAISAGYNQHFISAEKSDDRAFISRGHSMQETRFYFADAAALGYLNLIISKDKSVEINREVVDILNRLNHAIMAIVNAFIQKRGYAYRDAAE